MCLRVPLRPVRPPHPRRERFDVCGSSRPKNAFKRSCILLQGILHVLPDVTQVFPSLAVNYLNLAFYFQLFVTQNFSGDFLDLAFHLIEPALNLVFVCVHDTFLMMHAGKTANML
jgi:hypothetical protein